MQKQNTVVNTASPEKTTQEKPLLNPMSDEKALRKIHPAPQRSLIQKLWYLPPQERLSETKWKNIIKKVRVAKPLWAHFLLCSVVVLVLSAQATHPICQEMAGESHESTHLFISFVPEGHQIPITSKTMTYFPKDILVVKEVLPQKKP